MFIARQSGVIDLYLDADLIRILFFCLFTFRRSQKEEIVRAAACVRVCVFVCVPEEEEKERD